MPLWFMARQAPMIAWRTLSSSAEAMLSALSMVAPERGRFLGERFDLAKILRCEKRRRDHPRAACAGRVGKRRIVIGLCASIPSARQKIKSGKEPARA